MLIVRIAVLMIYFIFKIASRLVCSLLHHEEGYLTGLKTLQCITYILGILGKMAELSVFQNFYHYYFLSCLELIEIFQRELWEVETLVENVNVFLNVL